MKSARPIEGRVFLINPEDENIVAGRDWVSTVLAESKKLTNLVIRHGSQDRNYGKTSWGVTFHLEEVGTQRGIYTP